MIDIFSWARALADIMVKWLKPTEHPAGAALTAQGAKVSDSPVASGTGIVQTVNSPTFNLSLPTAAPGAPGSQRYNEWRELIHELHESFQQIGYAFLPLNVITPGIENNDYKAGIRRGYRVLRNRILIADVLKKAGVLEKFKSLVEYAVSAHTPRDPSQRGCPTMVGFDIKASKFEEELMELAQKDSGLAATETLPSTNATQSAVAPRKYVEPQPNIKYIHAETACLREPLGGGGLLEEEGKPNALLIRFANEARQDAPNLTARLKAVLIYRYGQTEIDVAGSWLSEASDVSDFAPDSRRHKLIAGILVDGTFGVITGRNIVAHRRSWYMSDKLELKGFTEGTVVVQLLDITRGTTLVYNREFVILTNPLSIFPKTA